jgi:hypothetical protein
LLKARYDLRAVENYFGTGNETPKTVTTRNYYRHFSRRVYGGLGLSLPITVHQVFDVSVFYQGIKVENKTAGYITSDHAIDSTLFDKNHFGGAELAYHFRRTNNDRFPTKGIDFLIAADYMQNLQETDRHFQNFVSALSVYIPLGRSFTLASRAGGATLIGDADFYHLNKLGGYVNLRGYDRERFTAKLFFIITMNCAGQPIQKIFSSMGNSGFLPSMTREEYGNLLKCPTNGILVMVRLLYHSV